MIRRREDDAAGWVVAMCLVFGGILGLVALLLGGCDATTVTEDDGGRPALTRQACIDSGRMWVPDMGGRSGECHIGTARPADAGAPDGGRQFP